MPSLCGSAEATRGWFHRRLVVSPALVVYCGAAFVAPKLRQSNPSGVAAGDAHADRLLRAPGTDFPLHVMWPLTQAGRQHLA